MLLLFDHCLGKTSSFSLLKYIFSSYGNELKKVRSESELNGDDTVLDFIGLVQRHGYPAEEHKVTTDDGYILTMHRIPNSPLSDKNKKKRVVFMQHGMTASSDSWVLLEPKKDLPILLADSGYDVWLGNFRGNTYCRSHINLTTDDPKFWEFSYHDIGLYDTPRYIDYILNYTGSKKLFYIGHSMGTSVSYVMLSMKPSYNDKMRLVISLAPVSYFKHEFPPAFQYIIKDVPKLKKLLEKEGIYDILPQSKMMKLLGAKLCNNKSIFQSICASIFYLVSGRDTAQTNTSLLPYFMSYVPAGVSTQSLFHYYQNYLTGNFEAYDYGYEGNLIHYKKAKPPVYDVKKIIAPLALFYGINDVLTNEKDATELSKRLSNLVTCEAVPYECFSHFDFVIANDVKTLLYDRLLNLMKQF
ncbi:lipase 3 [Vespula squamosa]|uniref:Lipase n=1 Tax=Vespula squamosa TaxID=30214 RepID=A0ABD1ZZR8_VESSQ